MLVFTVFIIFLAGVIDGLIVKGYKTVGADHLVLLKLVREFVGQFFPFRHLIFGRLLHLFFDDLHLTFLVKDKFFYYFAF